jgi:hypothetical protein
MGAPMMRAAILIWVSALLVKLAGWTDSLSVLSLTVPEGESFELALIKSAIVLMSWFGAVMVAPVLLLTAVGWRVLALSPTLSPSGRGSQ